LAALCSENGLRNPVVLRLNWDIFLLSRKDRDTECGTMENG